MKTEEDEAFDDLARKQGMWGGGFHAKRAAAADKLLEDQIIYGTSWSKNGERIDPSSVYLEVPAQEPVALVVDGVLVKSELPEKYTGHLYTTPPKREWVGLTDEETQAYWDWEDWQTGAGRSTIFEMVRDIEAKLKDKNI